MTPQTAIAPEKALVSKNGTAASKSQQTSSEINKLLLANTTLAVWLIFLAIGGGIFALYYARIGYLPDIEWKAALIYLFVGSIVGGAIGLLLTLSLFIPGVLWSEFIIFDPSLDFSYVARGKEPSRTKPVTELCIRSIARYLGLPFLVALFFSHVALLVGKKSYWVIAVGILVLTFAMMWKRFKGLLKNAKTREKDKPRQLFKYSSWFTLSVLLSQISMYVIYWLSGRPGNLSRLYKNGGLDWTNGELRVFIVLTLMCTAACWISNHVVALRHKQYPRQAVVACLLAAGLLLFTADHFSCLSMRLMNHYGFGDDQKVSLLLTNHGREIADSLNMPQCGKNALCDAEILSKVGDEYYLRVGKTYITLPKSEVVSIQRWH